MTAAEMLRTAREQGIELTPDGDRLRYSGRREALTPDLLIRMGRYSVSILLCFDVSNGRKPGASQTALQLSVKDVLNA